MVLTDEEMNFIDQNNLHESSSNHEIENQATSERNDVDFDEKYVELKKKIAEIDKHMTELKAYVNNSTKLIIDEIRSSRAQPTQTSHQEDDAHQHVEEIEEDRMDQPSISMRKYTDISNTDAHNSIDQTVGGVFNANISGSSTLKLPTLDNYPDLTMTQIVELDSILNVTTTPDLQPRYRNPGKYDTSPYIRLSEGESSVTRGLIFSRIKRPLESHNGFEVVAELIDEFNKCVFKDVSSRRGRSKINLNLKWTWCCQSFRMDFFNIMVKTGWPWKDECIRGFKLLATFLGTELTMSLFLSMLDLYANSLPNYVDKSQFDPLEVKHMKCVPQQEESFNDCSLYTCLFAEYISNRVFDMRSVHIDAKYHRQRTKNDDGAISESEVTGIVASKFDGPRIAKKMLRIPAIILHQDNGDQI
ncbi:hypothetical protein KY284_020868 [Solanum tuberosum]|nr:hypothetical protein KY284_020868 [Solanum tuberosum]